jgi:hypothetical protein
MVLVPVLQVGELAVITAVVHTPAMVIVKTSGLVNTPLGELAPAPDVTRLTMITATTTFAVRVIAEP